MKMFLEQQQILADWIKKKKKKRGPYETLLLTRSKVLTNGRLTIH